MWNLVKAEVKKLKRSWIVPISFLAVSATPFLSWIMIMDWAAQKNEAAQFSAAFNQVNIFHSILISIMVFTLIGAYMFAREYQENTLRVILTVPTRRGHFLLSKLIVLFAWILVLTWTLPISTIILGVLSGFQGLNAELVLHYYLQLSYEAIWQFLSISPFLLLTVLTKNFILPLGSGIASVLGSLLSFHGVYAAYYPWTIPLILGDPKMVTEPYPLWASYAIILAMGAGSLAILFASFRKSDVA